MTVLTLRAIVFAFALVVAGEPGAFAESSTAINLPNEIGSYIAKCWQAPSTDPPSIIEVTVRLSFSRSGAVIGQPRVTYIRAPAQAGLREKIAMSVLAAIKACTPLPFTPALGQAIAGRMFALRLHSLPVSGRPRFV